MTAKRVRAAASAALLATGLLASGVTSGCKGKFPNMISKSQQVQLGQQVSADVERQNRVVTSGPQYEQLQRVAARIIPLAERDFDVPYTVKLIDSKEINAFALPGGPIYFYRGLLELAQSEDEVAAVLGHEAAHVVKQHSAHQISQQNFQQLVAGLTLGNQGQAVQTLAGLGLGLVNLKFSRGDESESDKVGFRYLVQAGYEPEAMASMFRRMEQKSGRSGPEWLQSHPLTRKRVEEASKRAADYKQTGKLP